MAKKIEFILDVDSKPIDVAVDSTLNLKQQFRELTKELNRTKEGTKEFELLSSKLGEVQDNMTTTSAKSKDLFGSLSMLPGPVGQFSGSIDSAIGSLKTFTSFSFKDLKFQLGETLDDFKGIVSNIGKATGITKIYTTLNNALATSFVKVGIGEQAAATGARAFAAALTATGIGALVVLLGLAASALYDMATGEDEAKAATDRLNRSIESQNQLLDLNQKATKRRNAEYLATLKALGKSEKEIRDAQIKQAYDDYQEAFAAEAEARNLFNAQIGKADAEGAKKLQENLDKRVEATKDAYSSYIVTGRNAQATELAEQKQAQQKSIDANKQKQEKIAQDNKSANEMLLDLQRENDALTLTDQRKREDQELVNQKKSEEDKVNELQISQEKKNKILEQINIKFNAKQKDLDTKRKDDDLKAEKEFNDKVEEIRIAAIGDELERQKEERGRKLQKDLEDLEADKEFIKKSEKEKAEIRKNLLIAYNAEINKLVSDDRLKNAQIEKGEADAKFVRMIAGTQLDLDLQRKLLEEKKLRDDAYYAEQLSRENLTTEQIRDLNDRKLQDQIFYTEKSNEIERTRVMVRQRSLDDIISIVGAETDLGRAALIAKQIMLARELVLEAKRTITFSAQAAARSTVAVAEGTAQTAKVGFPQNIPLLIAYAAQAASILLAIRSAVRGANSSATSTDAGAAPETPNLGRNYEEGGLIGGRRHAQGGTLIEAEAGEAIMTRGAVTMFAPMLSMMNQMGGGTSFGNQLFIRPDAAAVEKPQIAQEPVIMKTYVVSNELTSEQEKLARLKDLSTL